MKRAKQLDIVKGILIFLVVFAHYSRGIAHNIIFLFHMPLFFVLSGYFYKSNTVFDLSYVKKCTGRYLLPYLVYLVVIFLVFDHNFSIKYIAKQIYGGRAIGNTYWYMTCFVFTLFLFTFIRSKFSDNTTKLLILAGGV